MWLLASTDRRRQHQPLSSFNTNFQSQIAHCRRRSATPHRARRGIAAAVRDRERADALGVLQNDLANSWIDVQSGPDSDLIRHRLNPAYRSVLSADMATVAARNISLCRVSAAISDNGKLPPAADAIIRSSTRSGAFVGSQPVGLALAITWGGSRGLVAEAATSRGNSVECCAHRVLTVVRALNSVKDR